MNDGLHLYCDNLCSTFWFFLKTINTKNAKFNIVVHTTETEWYTDINTENDIHLHLHHYQTLYPKNAILLHLHYQDLWPEFWSYLKDIKDETTHIYVTVHTTETEWYNDIKSNVNEVFVIENKGTDFGGFLYAYNKIKHIDYLTITKLHGKKSLRLEPGSNIPGPKDAGGGARWRKELYLPLIETKEKYTQNISLFQKDPYLFMIGSKKFIQITGIHVPRSSIKYQSGKYWIDSLLNIGHISREKHVSGSMFTCTKEYLNMFFKNKELELLSNMEEGYKLESSGHHLECVICNCEPFGGHLLGI